MAPSDCPAGAKGLLVCSSSAHDPNLALPPVNAFRVLLDGEAAKLEEARHKPDTKMAPRHEDYCSEIDLRFGVAGNP